VATEGAGVSELIEDGKTGYLVLPGAEAIAVRLNQVFRDITSRRLFAEEAYRYFVLHHRLDRQADHLIEMYKELAWESESNKSKFFNDCR